MKGLAWLGVVLVSLVAGCTRGNPPPGAPAAQDRAMAVARNEMGVVAGKRAGEVEGRKEAGGEKQDGERARKVIYTGDVSLVVEKFEEAEEALLRLVDRYKGEVARSDVQGVPGNPRSGTWTVRIPVGTAERFRKAVSELGELRRSTLDSRDVTDQYHDTQATMANLKAREKALRALYDRKIGGDSLKELLEVDRELSQVRGQIEVLEGRIKRWDKETAYTTYQISLLDRNRYVPGSAPDFVTTLDRTLGGSVDALLSAGKGLVVVLVAVGPWMVVLVPLGLAGWWASRRVRRAAQVTAQPPATGGANPSGHS